jgi:hypothetical protein
MCIGINCATKVDSSTEAGNIKLKKPPNRRLLFCEIQLSGKNI